jgi:hypothetical protein
MRINYLITAYNEPELLSRIIKRLEHENSFFYIHIDKRVEITLFKNCAAGNNIVFLDEDDRVISQWGDISTCDAILNLMKVCISDIMKLENIEDRKGYCIVMFGTDYPIKTIEEINTFLIQNYPTNFIHYLALEDCDGYLKKWVESHINYYWLTIKDKFKIVIAPYSHIRPKGIRTSDCNFRSILRVISQTKKILKLFFIKRQFPLKLHCYTSETWFEVTTDTVVFLLDFLKNNPDIYNYYKMVGLPEEKFFQSVILSYKDVIRVETKDFLIYLNRNWPGGRKGILDIKNEDWDVLKEAIKNPNYLFARKLSFTSEKLLNQIDTFLGMAD